MLRSESNLDSELQGDMNYHDPLVHIIFLRIELWWAGEWIIYELQLQYELQV